jgi:hypothetical protein
MQVRALLVNAGLEIGVDIGHGFFFELESRAKSFLSGYDMN